MRFIYLFLLIISIFSYILAESEVDLSISTIDERRNTFYFSICQHYGVPEREVLAAREAGIEDEELPVLFFISLKAKVSPSIIISLRKKRVSWMDISLRYSIDAGVFYVPVDFRVNTPPYGRAYGYYMHYQKKEWNKIRLQDSDIRNLVNLRFISEYYKCHPAEIIKMRSKGNDFLIICSEMEKKHGNIIREKQETLKETNKKIAQVRQKKGKLKRSK